MFTTGIAHEIRREHILHFTMNKQSLPVTQHRQKRQKTLSRKSLSIPFSNSEPLPAMDPNQHHQISDDTRHPQDISRMLGDNYDDPATKVHTELEYFSCCSLR